MGATRHAGLEQKFEFLVRVEEIGEGPMDQTMQGPVDQTTRCPKCGKNEWSR